MKSCMADSLEAKVRSRTDELEKRVAERTAELSQQLHFVKQLIEAIPGPFFYKDANARYLGCNSAFEALIGRPESELIGKTAQELTPGELNDKHQTVDRELLARPGLQIYESQLSLASGEVRDLMFHKATIIRHDGTVDGMVGLMLDITERKRMENNLRLSATLFECSAEGVTITRPDATIIAVNRAFTEITGYSESEVLDKDPRILQSGRHGKHFYNEMWASITRDDCWQGEVWNRRKNGEIYPEWLSITTVRDQGGELVNYVATFSDITHHKQNEDRIHLLAFSDQLTRLPNRRLLLDRLQHAVVNSSRSRLHGALFIIDLDDFKSLNDTRGHDTGDLLLQQVAERLSKCVREGDTVARIGGDEFVVMLEDLSIDIREATNQVRAIGENILAALKDPYMLLDYQHHSTQSIGVTLFGSENSSVELLLKQADLAMYQAKESGRNSLRFFDPQMQKVVSARVALESDLREGLKKHQFILHYQPQMNHLCEVIGAEALVRWMHPLRGMVSPAEFIPLAEETELILPLGSWVLQTACHQLSAWSKQPETAHLTMAVNVSARQFRQQCFISQVMAALDISGADPVKLKLEITESLLLENVQEIITKMTVLKARGVCFSLDDFGTGYSSLTYLKRLPLDQLKIDQSFVRDVLIDHNDAAIARSIVGLAHSLELGVIAEGVETEDQLLFLASIGCHSYQGFLYSKPLPIAEFEAFIHRKLAEKL
jgi:diguanylate cyclase (GGDEF)-like protein/PAS domain S-box-containing protein